MREAQYSNTPTFHYSNSRFVSAQPADEIFPAAQRKTLVGVVHFQLFSAEIFRLAVQQGQVIPLAQHRQPGGALDHLLDAFADHGVAVGAHQHRRSVAQRGCQVVAPFEGAHQADSLINWRAVGGEKLAIMMQRLELDRQHAEDRAPFGMGMRHADNFRPGFENAGVDRPFVGRSRGAVEMVAGKILHDQAVARDRARTDIGDGDKRVRAGHAHADVAVAVGDAFMVENMTGGNQFVGELLKLGRIDGGNVFATGSHACSFRLNAR